VRIAVRARRRARGLALPDAALVDESPVASQAPPAARGDRMAACQNARMDTEEINAIGTLLADLSQRTQQLRGYL
jgi:hypothetical protein